MEPRRIVKLANSVAEYFWDPRLDLSGASAASPALEAQRETAALGIAEHLRKFWDPRMRRELLALVDRLPGEVRPQVDQTPLVLAASLGSDEPDATLMPIVVRAVELERHRWFPPSG